MLRQDSFCQSKSLLNFELLREPLQFPSAISYYHHDVPKRIKNDKKFELKSARQITQADKKILDLQLKQAEKLMIPILKNLFTDNFKKIRLAAYSPIFKRVKKLKVVQITCCGTRIFRHQDIKKAYKCYDCQIHKDSILCYQCFFDGNHRGHRYVDVQVDGICDCGNDEIIKQQGFCSRHKSKGKIQQKIILQDKDINYTYFVKIIFTWVFKIYQCNYTIYAEILLKELIHYLLEINQSNCLFLEENIEIFFKQVDKEGLCLADHLIELYCKYQIAKRSTAINETKLFEFFTRFFKDPKLGAQIFLAYCKAYSRNLYFFKSQLINHLNHLATLTDVCKIALTKHNQNEPFLDYKKSKNLFIYYEQLHNLLEAMPSEIAAEFINPFLKVHIPFPYMRRSYEQKFNQICQTEHLYINLLSKIISLVSDKEKLHKLLSKYIGMSKTSNEDKKFQLGLYVSHKIIGLILLQYSENNLSNLSHKKNAFCQQDKRYFYQILKQSLRNLVKFCNTISYKNRLTYNWNYAKYYKKIHAVYYDILIVQAILRIIPENEIAIQDIILKILQNPQEKIYRQKFKADKDCLARYIVSTRILKINVLNMLAEVVYSRIPQIYFGAKLRQYGAIKKLSEETLQSIFNTLQEISESKFNSIKSEIFGGYLSEEIVENIATFNNKTKMYKVRQQGGEKFNFNIFISLAQSQLYSLYTNYICQPQMQKQVILTQAFGCFSQQNRNIFHPIFSNKIVEYAFQQILNIIDDQTSFHRKNDQLKMAIKLNKTLSNLYYNKDLLGQNFQLIKNTMLKLAQTVEIDPQNYYLENYHMINEAQTTIQKKQGNKKEDMQKLKERQRQKRQALMRAKKIKENQLILVTKEEVVQEQTKDQNICVMCKQKGKLCYISKISFTNLLFHYFDMNGNSFTLDTCQHTIHYDCFIECHQQKNIKRCPLCRQSFNTVIPIEYEDSQQLDKCGNYYEYLLESIRQEKINLLEESLLYLYYQQKMFNYFKLGVNSQELIKSKFINALIKHMQKNFGYIENQEDYVESDITFREQFQRFKCKILGIQAIGGEQKHCEQLLPNIVQAQFTNIIDQSLINESQNNLNSIQLNKIQAEKASIIKTKCEAHLLNLPSTIEEYLYFRDDYLLTKQKSSQPILCLLCNTSKIIVDDLCLPSLFLNIKNATIQYRQSINNKYIFGIYQDENGEYWNIKKKTQGFTLNKNRLDTIFRALVNNNLEFLEKSK